MLVVRRLAGARHWAQGRHLQPSPRTHAAPGLLNETGLARALSGTFVVIEFVLMLSNAISNTAGLGGASAHYVFSALTKPKLAGRLRVMPHACMPHGS